MGVRVLIVDDNEDQLKSLCTLLRLHGHETKEAHDASDIAANVREFDPDAVILDLGMPGKSGMDAAKEIRASFPGSNRPMLIALTGARGSGIPESFNYFLTKPCDINVLLALVGQSKSSR